MCTCVYVYSRFGEKVSYVCILHHANDNINNNADMHASISKQTTEDLFQRFKTHFFCHYGTNFRSIDMGVFF